MFSLSLSLFGPSYYFLKLLKEVERKNGEVQWEANLGSAMKDCLLHPQGRSLALTLQEAIEEFLFNSWVSFLHFWLFTKEFGLFIWLTLCPRGHRSQLKSTFLCFWICQNTPFQLLGTYVATWEDSLLLMKMISVTIGGKLHVSWR